MPVALWSPCQTLAIQALTLPVVCHRQAPLTSLTAASSWSPCACHQLPGAHLGFGPQVLLVRMTQQQLRTLREERRCSTAWGRTRDQFAVQLPVTNLCVRSEGSSRKRGRVMAGEEVGTKGAEFYAMQPHGRSGENLKENIRTEVDMASSSIARQASQVPPDNQGLAMKCPSKGAPIMDSSETLLPNHP